MGLLGPAARCVRVNCRSSVKTACKRLHDSKLVQGFVTHSLSIVGHAEKNMAVDSVEFIANALASSTIASSYRRA